MEEPLHFTSTLEISTNKLWGAHLPVPAPIAQVFLTEGAKRVVCKLNDTVEFQCALLPKGEGVYCIVVNKKIREQLGLREGSTARVSLHKDESEYGLPMPDELAEVLAQPFAAGDGLGVVHEAVAHAAQDLELPPAAVVRDGGDRARHGAPR